MRTTKLSMTILLAGVLAASGLAAVAPASALPPSNDSITSPRNVTSLPFRASVDTRDATRGPEDGSCEGGASVWFRYRPATTGRARMNTVGSNYDTLLGLYQGTRNNRTLLACDDDGVGVQSALRARFVAGTTYWISVSSCCSPRGSGGTAVLNVYRSVPPELTASIDSAESGGVSGRLFIEADLTCAMPSLAFVEVFVSQRVGQNVANGWGYGEFECGPTLTTARIRVDSETGWAFEPGQAAVSWSVSAYDGFSSLSDEGEGNMTVTDNPLLRARR